MADRVYEGLGSLRAVLTENYPSEAVDRARRASDRLAAERMMDTEYLADVEERWRPMNEGRGSVFTALGYHGSPGSDEGQASISHYKEPMGDLDTRTFATYTPKAPANASQEDIDREMARIWSNYSFYGDPPTVGGIAIDASSQLHGEFPDKKAPYGDTLYHEFKHRGFDSEALQRLKDSAATSAPGGNWGLYAKILRAESEIEQHAVFELIRQIEQGEVTYKELSEEDRERLDNFEDVEKALSDSFTEKERLKMGVFERNAPVTPPNPSDPVEMPEGYRAGGRVRLI